MWSPLIVLLSLTSVLGSPTPPLASVGVTSAKEKKAWTKPLPPHLRRPTQFPELELGVPHLQIRSENTTYRYRTKDTEPFLVESLPQVDFDFGELYSGSFPIGNNASESLFFVFKPRDGPPVDELTIWLNGGPGCSSLMGWLQENGPILWQPGTPKPVSNPYAWSTETNMIWVEQPIGTGFSLGTPKAQTEEEIAQDFLGFLKHFQNTFGIKNYKIYVTGESYAGRYVPYISAAMVDRADTENFDISGALVYDPCIGDTDNVHQEIPAYASIERNKDLWGLNDTFLAQLEETNRECGYKDYIDKYLQFPPVGNQPTIPPFNDDECDVFGQALNAVYDINPCFNIYEIVDHCPPLLDPLGYPASSIWLRRPDVIEALHAPNIKWSDCARNPVFVGKGDQSADSIQKVLPQVIEHTNRVLVSNAEWGTLLAIQNMTWNGQLGFQSAPSEPFVVDLPDVLYSDPEDGPTNPQGIMGIKHYERGLMWVESFQAGHMQPQYQPRAALKHLRWILGRDDDL